MSLSCSTRCVDVDFFGGSRIYFLQQLDKSTLSYASVFNFAANTGLVGYQYSALGSIVYAGWLACYETHAPC